MSNPLTQAQTYVPRYDLIKQIAEQLETVGNANCQVPAANLVHAMDAQLDNAFILEMRNRGINPFGVTR